jgi:2-polyprenyl-3-methyl-5-hydroxy-6-metoxy-1,4-benzoquinol methylase
MPPRLSQRDRAEIERSASQAHKIALKSIPKANVQRYLNPPLTTPFALEYAFYLLGDVRGKTVLDLGCGTGESIFPLLARGARVLGIDVSPELIAIAQQRLREAKLEAAVSVDSAYETGLPNQSVDVVFCMALIHHLEIGRVRDEISRILRPGGVVILREPIRFSKVYGHLRSLLPAQEDISEFEHPLTHEELDEMARSFKVEDARYFRLPFVPLISGLLPSQTDAAWRASDWSLRHWPAMEHFATSVVMRLRKTI